MAVAAYASVLSLLRVLINIQLPSRLRLFPDTTQINALRQKLCFLQDFFEVHSSAITEDIERTARKIPEVASEIESIIDKYVVHQLYRELYPQNDYYDSEISIGNYAADQLYKGSEDVQNDVVGWNIESFNKELHRAIQEIETINEALTKLRTIQHDQQQPIVSFPAPPLSRLKQTVVGFEDQIKQVLDKLTGNQPDLVIVPIVGMGGIGKTTLARSVFNHPYNREHFHMRIWLTISKHYSVKEILQGLLNDGVLGDKKDKEGGVGEKDLATRLYKKLFGQRYLIVMDDVWSEEAWRELKHCFPNNKKESRVMMTTRLSEIAGSLDVRTNSYSMQFLDEKKSWDLFRETAFEQGGWSPELEKIARNISKRCNGLPLMLVLIGGLLANSDMTTKYWQAVAEDINSFANSSYDGYISRTLSLSYDHLPIHLKPCFLYMRHFEEDSKIDVSELIERWAAQGFVKPMAKKRLEEAAIKYLEDLVGRNMFLIHERGHNGNIQVCGIHDTLRDFCINEAKKEQLSDVPRILSVANDFDEACCLCEQPRTKQMLLFSAIPGSFSLCSSCISTLPELGRSRLVVEVKTNSQNVPVMTRYRQLSIGRYMGSLVDLHSIRLLWNLESLQIGLKSPPSMPEVIWEMPQLRHVIIDDGFMLPEPVDTTNDVIVLENLETLKSIKNFKWSEEIVRRVPNLRDLGTYFFPLQEGEEEDLSCFHLQNLAQLLKLESLSVDCINMVCRDFKKVIAFPQSLTSLTLKGCNLAWYDLTIIALLPNLEVLKLLKASVLGEEWSPVEEELGEEWNPIEEFLKLKYLELDSLDLVDWRVDSETQFRALETLVLTHMENLKEIPVEFGELLALNSIYLKRCSENIIDSAYAIVEKQQSCGNESLVVHNLLQKKRRAVAAYASVLSLLRVIDNIQLPSRRRLFPNTKRIDALREKLCSLQHFFEVRSSTVTEDMERIARKIPEVTNEIESLIDNYMVDQLYKESKDLRNDVMGGNIESFHNEIHRVTKEIESINEALRTIQLVQEQSEVSVRSLASSGQKNIMEKFTSNKPLNNYLSLPLSREKNKMVGFDDQLEQVLEKLIGNQPNLVIVSIVGMGGIGKTTLARSVFDHPYNLHHFSVRIWLTISQDYSVKKVLQGLLRDGVLGDKKDRKLGDKSEAELIMRLYQKLFGQRYLIVLDDVWSAEVWDDLKRGFPNNGRRSRVMVTTRLSNLAMYLDSPNNIYSMKFLDKDKSWDLFSEKAFEKGGRSRELEVIGREISRHCKGLPLLLVLIGGLLANSNMTVEYWQTVAEGINSFANSEYDDYCLRILSLSYHHLPIHLKPCFLCMRHFEEDSEVVVSELIKTWVAQGFVKSKRGKSVEEVAREYLEDLVGRNILLVCKRGNNGNIKTCAIHDLLRDFCMREYFQEQLFEVPRILSISYHFDETCFLCKAWKRGMMMLYGEIIGSESAYYGKILLCTSCESTFQEFVRPRFVVASKTDSQNALLMTSCRWLTIDYTVKSLIVLRTIRLVWNLEILHVRRLYLQDRLTIPREIWEMPQLRHLKVDDGFMLADPAGATNDVIVLENLQTIKTIVQFKCSKDIVRRIPNLRKLGLYYDDDCCLTDEEEDRSSFYLHNLARLQKLESLSITCYKAYLDFKLIAFPSSLKKLTLLGCRIACDNLAIISSSLPNLQVLKLLRESIIGKEWDIEGELFLRLKYLELDLPQLVLWRVDHETQFPALETLVLKRMHHLKAIPREIGELAFLNSIYLERCAERIIDSARKIVEEQVSNGNEGQLVVHVDGTYQRVTTLCVFSF